MKTATQIVDRTMTLIDEAVVEILDSASTEMSAKEIGLEILPEVARNLIKELPYELKFFLAESGVLLPIADTAGEDQTDYRKQRVKYQLPADFHDLVSVKLNVWNAPVLKYITAADPGYRKQLNPFTRSGAQNPVVAVTSGGDNKAIELYSIYKDDVATVDEFKYIKFSNVPDDAGNTWPDELFEHITKALAAELHAIKDRMEKAQQTGDDALTAIEQFE